MILRSGADDYDDDTSDDTSAKEWDHFPRNHDGDQEANFGKN